MLGVISTFIMSGKLRSQIVLTEQSSAAFKYRSDALSGNSFSHILRKNFEIPQFEYSIYYQQRQLLPGLYKLKQNQKTVSEQSH